jgi:TonB family protein
MKPNQSLKLRIEQNGKVTERYLRGKDEFTVGRSPDNDIVLYGEKYPKRLRMFIPTGSGYELRLADETRGEVSFEKSRFLFSDLLLHDLLPKRDGCPALPLRPGKSGHLILDSVRIDFHFDGGNVEGIEFDCFSPTRGFMKSMKDDPFFKGLVAVLLIMQMAVLQGASTIEIKPPDQADQAKLMQKVQKIAATFKPVEEIRTKVVASSETQAASESSGAEKKIEKKIDETKTAEANEKPGYGSEKPGEGVDMSKFEVLALIGGTGASGGSSDLMNKLMKDDLAKSLDQVMNSGKLSAGRSQSGTGGTDVNAVLAHSILGDGKGGVSGIDKLLENDAAQNKPAIILEKKTKIDVAPIEKVSGAQEAVGARNEQSLYKVLSQNIGRLQYIYEKFLKTNPDIRGKVEVEVTINPDGRIANVVVLSSEIPLQEFQQQIRDAIRRWKYEAIAQGQMKVVYPIVFNKVG